MAAAVRVHGGSTVPAMADRDLARTPGIAVAVEDIVVQGNMRHLRRNECTATRRQAAGELSATAARARRVWPVSLGKIVHWTRRAGRPARPTRGPRRAPSPPRPQPTTCATRTARPAAAGAHLVVGGRPGAASDLAVRRRAGPGDTDEDLARSPRQRGGHVSPSSAHRTTPYPRSVSRSGCGSPFLRAGLRARGARRDDHARSTGRK